MTQKQIDLVIYCDNAAVTQLVSHLNASSTRTRHLSMRGAWLHDLHQRQALSLFFIDTHEQKADALTKGLGAAVTQPLAYSVCKDPHYQKRFETSKVKFFCQTNQCKNAELQSPDECRRRYLVTSVARIPTNTLG
eukprot:2416168-Amphidinium_carterae.1